ncbi:MAG: dipeptidase, partial [Candidatus Heimdallarchaeota archaeon]|nr:dipeptidase [Candidatus Heimdallarchaeota archaeon]
MYIDTHLDTRWALTRQDRSFSIRSSIGHIDLDRARDANLLCGFFTGYPTESQYSTESMLKDWIIMTNDPNNHFIRINQYQDLEKHLNLLKTGSTDKIGSVLHFEGAAGIDTELNRLYIYYDLGLRSLGVTWNDTNQFATGVPGPIERGFTKEGLDLLDALNSLGIMVDVSHLNDTSFWDVINHSTGPVFASHSNLRKYADDPRNLTDEMVIAISDTGGSIGINLCKGFLSTDQAKHPANMGCAVSMIKEVIGLTSINSVHIGTDMDGCTLSDDLLDITSMPTFFTKV